MNKFLPILIALVVAGCKRESPFITKFTSTNALAVSNTIVLPDSKKFGIGASIRPEGRDTIIVGVVPGSPAYESGLVIGDHIIAIDGQTISNLWFGDVVDSLAGERDSTVRVLIQHSEGSESTNRLVTLRRTFQRY